MRWRARRGTAGSTVVERSPFVKDQRLYSWRSLALDGVWQRLSARLSTLPSMPRAADRGDLSVFLDCCLVLQPLRARVAGGSGESSRTCGAWPPVGSGAQGSTVMTNNGSPIAIRRVYCEVR